jgi:hypothetical protein
MKTIPVNFIGYGDWGSRLSKKIVSEGFSIENLVTNKTDVFVEHNNLIRRKNISNIDWTLPTFISTGPLYHHQILKHAKCRAFVEKPFYVMGQKEQELKYKPYVNYQWYNSLKLKTIKNFIGYEWSNLDIKIFTTTNIERKFTTLEDFLPHVLSIIKFINPNPIISYKIIKISDDIFRIEFKFEFNKINFEFGKSTSRYTQFITDNFFIEASNPYSIEVNDIKYTLNRDPLRDTIYRYYEYYKTGLCDRIFYSNEFHKLTLKMIAGEQL